MSENFRSYTIRIPHGWFVKFFAVMTVFVLFALLVPFYLDYCAAFEEKRILREAHVRAQAQAIERSSVNER